MHYVSTLQAEFRVSSSQTSTNNSCVNLGLYDNEINNCNCKRKNSVYMKENRQKRKAERAFLMRKEKKNNQYMKSYQTKKKISSFGFQSFMT